ncbi:MAG: hypothetical protein H7249_14660 [Chitinophagaceae bacterium]|nr:hypothetical protein [Oligoflexus sp.]
MRNVLLLLFLSLSAAPAWSQTRRIVTYIDDVQEERKTTRWTLTEWLRIKERMKMMDVWLAMFSKPQEKFAPELSFSYAKSVGTNSYELGTLAGFETDKKRTMAPDHAEDGRLQFWFTNLVSGTTGLRTLAIDLGIEGRIHNRFVEGLPLVSDPAAAAYKVGSEKVQQGGLNLRLFGANTQDSSLVVKFGKYDHDTGFVMNARQSGQYFGGEMSLYFLSILGAEANYYQYMDGKVRAGDSVDYLGFLEIYNIRVGYGESLQNWQWKDSVNLYKTHENDRFLMLRLYF